MADERDPSTHYEILGHVAHKLHYTKIDRIGINSSSVNITSWGKSPKMCRHWKHADQMEVHCALVALKDIHRKKLG
jgi:hypothetical protein